MLYQPSINHLSSTSSISPTPSTQSSYSYNISYSRASSPHITYLSILALIITLLIQPIHSIDCIFHPQNFTITAQRPMNPLKNCRQYCQTYYSDAPQRASYNPVTQNCQPLRRCKLNSGFYYSQQDNKCYIDSAHSQQTDSEIPDSVTQSTLNMNKQQLPFKPDYTTPMICVNGQIHVHLQQNKNSTQCRCKFLWTNSLRFDMKGIPIFCDKVTDHPQDYFVNNLTKDTNNKITHYGMFSAQQMQIMILNFKKYQERQKRQFIVKNYQSVLYVIDQMLPIDPYLSGIEYLYLFIGIVIMYMIFWASYTEYRELRVRVTFQRLQDKIIQATQNDAIIRRVY